MWELVHKPWHLSISAGDCGCPHALQQQELNPNGASNEDYQTADSEN